MTILNQYPIRVEIDGVTVMGTYSVWSGIITVTSEAGVKMALVGGMPPRTLARIMLRELDQDRKQQP